MTIDWDGAFDNAGYIENAAAFPGRWAGAAEHARDTLAAALAVPYGEAPRERFDLFVPEGVPEGLIVFVHGGYWHKFDRSYWSHLARGPLGRGWAAAILEYPLAPDARIAGITAAVGRGIEAAAGRVAGPLRLVGHSAGGHLVTRMICEDTRLSATTRARLARVVSISGVHDLRPLLATRMNDILRLTAEEAARESPALLTPLKGIPVSAWVGARERPEFLRQTRLLTEAWGRFGLGAGQTGIDALGCFEDGENHFTVIAGLSWPDSDLMCEVLR